MSNFDSYPHLFLKLFSVFVWVETVEKNTFYFSKLVLSLPYGYLTFLWVSVVEQTPFFNISKYNPDGFWDTIDTSKAEILHL